MSLGFTILNNVELVKTHFYEPGFIDLPDAVRIGSVNRAFYQKYFCDPNLRVWILHNNLFTRQFKVLRALTFADLGGSESYGRHLSVITKVQSALGNVSKQIPFARLAPLENQISKHASEYEHIVRMYYTLTSQSKALREAWGISDELTRLLKYREIFQRAGYVGPAFVWLIKNLVRLDPNAVVETAKLLSELGLGSAEYLNEITKFLLPIMPDAAYAIYKMHRIQFSTDTGPLADFPNTALALEIAAARRFEGSRNRCYGAIAQGLVKRDVELCRSTLDRITEPRIYDEATIDCIEGFLSLQQLDNAIEFAELTDNKDEAYRRIANHIIGTSNELPKWLLDFIESPRVIFDLKKKLAVQLAPSDITRALALIESIKDPACRASAYIECIEFVPRSKWDEIVFGIDWNADSQTTISFIKKIVNHDPRMALHVFMKMSEPLRIYWLWTFFHSVVEVDFTVAEITMGLFQSENQKNAAKFQIDLWRQYPDVEKLCTFLHSEKDERMRPAIIHLIAKLDINRAISELEISDQHLLRKLIKIQAQKDPLRAMGTVQLLGEEDTLALESIIVNEGVFANIPQVLKVYNQITTPILKVQMLSVICEMMPTAHDLNQKNLLQGVEDGI